MLNEYEDVMHRLTDSCMACHDACVLAGYRRADFPEALREVLLELIKVCADACRITAGALVSPTAETYNLTRACGGICDACGHALADLPRLAGCARSCLDCSAACRQYASLSEARHSTAQLLLAVQQQT